MSELPVIDEKLRRALGAIFYKILDTFATADSFGRDSSPTIFIVYAHNNPKVSGKADDHIPKHLIHILDRVGSRTTSDRGQYERVYWADRDSDTNQNIIGTQCIILPKSRDRKLRDKVSGADKVILCWSEVLEDYYKNNGMKGYINAIKEFYYNQGKDLRHKDNEKLKEELKKITARHSKDNPTFHHVLTEMAFLEIRHQELGNNHGIIPVQLNRGNDLPKPEFLSNNTDIWQSAPDVVESIDPNKTLIHDDHNLHLWVFKLLKRLFDNFDQRMRIVEFEKCYKMCVEELGKLEFSTSTTSLPSWKKFEDWPTLNSIVQREIAAASERITRIHISAQRTAPNTEHFHVGFHLPGVKTNKFIGRTADLKSIEGYLKPNEEPKRQNICVLHGLGGIGKTQLAIEYARVHQAAYTSSFFLNGKTEDLLIQELVSIGDRLPKGQISDTDIEDITDLQKSKRRAQEVLEWFSRSRNTLWLLIYDNIDEKSYGEDTTGQTSKYYDITEYLPKSDTGSIIITTRLSRLADLGHEVNLRRLNVEDSLLILQKQVGRSLKQPSSSDNDGIEPWDLDAVSLVNRLGHLPLALVLAGSFISKSTIVKYRELYDESWERLHRKMKRPDYPERTIDTTWQISFDAVKEQNYGAAKLLQLWGYLDNQELWLELLKWRRFNFQKSAPAWLQNITTDDFSFSDTINILLSYSLIEKNENSDTYSIHLVLQDWMRESVNSKDQEEMMWTAITTVGLATPEEDKKDFITAQRRVLQHAVQIYNLHCLGDLSKDQGKLAEAEKMYQRALAGYEKALGLEHASTFNTINNLGSLYKNQGKLAEAEKMYQRALTGYEKALGLDDTTAPKLNTINNLGNLYKDQGKLAEAEKMYQRALAGKKKALGPEHTSTLNTINNLGILYKNQGKLAEAEKMYKRALAGYEKALGPEHTSTLNTINNLGNLYKDQGRLAEAEKMYQRALAGYEKALGPEHASTLNTINNLGNLYKDQGKLAEAEKMYQQALAGKKKAFGLEQNNIIYIARIT